MSNTLAAVTLIGQKHKNREVPCEDSSIAVSANGVDVVVVCDGAGSKQYTHAKLGSQAAVDAISKLFIEHFDAIYNENREAAIKSLIIATIHVKFAELMQKHSLDSIERLSCTLLFTAVKDRRVIVGHLGDGLIARISATGASPFTMPQNDKAGHTYFVTANHAADYMRLVKTTTDDIHAIALMTDGVQDSVYNEDSGLVKPVVARMAETLSSGRENAEKELTGIISKYIVGGSNNSDDSSFGVIYFDKTSAPDTKAMKSSADAFPRCDETFQELQASMVDDVKNARKIMMEAAGKNPVATPAPVKKPEQTEKSDKSATTVKKTAKTKKSILTKLLYFVAIVELIIIIALIYKIFFLK